MKITLIKSFDGEYSIEFDNYITQVLNRINELDKSFLPMEMESMRPGSRLELETIGTTHVI